MNTKRFRATDTDKMKITNASRKKICHIQNARKKD